MLTEAVNIRSAQIRKISRVIIFVICIGSIFLGLSLIQSRTTMSKTFLSVDFEVFGRVQGVFFRKYTHAEANKLNLTGWCRNTRQDTVDGVIQGEAKNINSMKHWLQNTGSPQSKIDHVNFKNEREITKLDYTTFDIRK